MSEYFRDVIYLNELRLCGIIGEDAWDRPGRWQPIIITMNVVIHRSSAPSIDDITLTFNYSEMYRQISGVVDRKYFHCIDHVLGSLSKLCLNWPGQVVELTVSTPESVLRLEGGMKKVCRWRRDEQSTNRPFVDQAWFIETLKIACIVGIQPHERVEKQTVHIKIQLNDREDEPTICRGFAEPGHFEWRKSVRGICEVGEEVLEDMPDVFSLIFFY